MIGVTIGSGVGRLEGLYGLVADALESVRIVIANGTLLTASRRENPDLFWAIRGAGANFGVITSATYNVHPLPRGGNMTYIDMQMPGYMNASYFEALGEFVNGDNEMPAELSVSSKMGFDVNSGGVSMLFRLGAMQANCVEGCTYGQLGLRWSRSRGSRNPRPDTRSQCPCGCGQGDILELPDPRQQLWS